MTNVTKFPFQKTVEHFTELEPETLQAAGGNDFWQSPLYGVDR